MSHDKMVCPFCGSEHVTWVSGTDGPGYYAMCLFRGENDEIGCGSEGPLRETKEAALAAFCTPAWFAGQNQKKDGE